MAKVASKRSVARVGVWMKAMSMVGGKITTEVPVSMDVQSHDRAAGQNAVAVSTRGLVVKSGLLWLCCLALLQTVAGNCLWSGGNDNNCGCSPPCTCRKTATGDCNCHNNGSPGQTCLCVDSQQGICYAWDGGTTAACTGASSDCRPSNPHTTGICYGTGSSCTAHADSVTLACGPFVGTCSANGQSEVTIFRCTSDTPITSNSYASSPLCTCTGVNCPVMTKTLTSTSITSTSSTWTLTTETTTTSTTLQSTTLAPITSTVSLAPATSAQATTSEARLSTSETKTTTTSTSVVPGISLGDIGFVVCLVVLVAAAVGAGLGRCWYRRQARAAGNARDSQQLEMVSMEEAAGAKPGPSTRAKASPGLGAEPKDIREWEVINIHRNLKELEEERKVQERMVFHYTNLETAQAILTGGQGLRMSSHGMRGGGLFFSTVPPVDDQLLAEHKDETYKNVFHEFRDRQLARNYGTDVAGRERNVDVVLVCFVPSKFAEEVDPQHRPGAVYISKAYFSLVPPAEDGFKYFPLEKIVAALHIGGGAH